MICLLSVVNMLAAHPLVILMGCRFRSCFSDQFLKRIRDMVPSTLEVLGSVNFNEGFETNLRRSTLGPRDRRGSDACREVSRLVTEHGTDVTVTHRFY